MTAVSAAEVQTLHMNLNGKISVAPGLVCPEPVHTLHQFCIQRD